MSSRLRSLRHSDSKSGFTLLELIVVIVILGVLAAVSIPTFQSVIAKSQDSTTKAKLAAVGRDALAIYTLGGTTLDQALVSAAGETSAFAPGTSAAALTAVADSGNTQPTAGQIVYKLSGSSLGYALFAKSGDTCYALLSSAGVSSAVTWCNAGSADPAATALAGPTAATTSPSASASPSAVSGSLAVFAGTGASGPPTPGSATSSAISQAAQSALDSAGNLYVADTSSQVVEKITPSGTLSVYAGTGSGCCPVPGPATSSPINSPAGVAVDSSGNLFVSDNTNYMVYKVTPSGTLSVFAGNGNFGTPVAGTATSTPLGGVRNLAVDSAGNLYIADASNNRIEKVTPSGTLSIYAGNGTSAASTAGVATSTPIAGPTTLAVDSAGNLYASNSAKCQIVKVDTSGNLTVVAGTGTCVASVTPGPASSTPLSGSLGLGVSPAGTLYFTASSSNAEVLRLSAGQISVYAGTGPSAAPTPGPATSSPLYSPQGIVFDSAGNGFISDNRYIEKVNA